MHDSDFNSICDPLNQKELYRQRSLCTEIHMYRQKNPAKYTENNKTIGINC